MHIASGILFTENLKIKLFMLLVADRVSTSRSHGAEFFAVASGVQIPYVGRDETGVNASRINSPSFSDEFPPRMECYCGSKPILGGAGQS